MNRFNDSPLYYRIKVRGLLDDRRLHWFDGMTITQDEGITTLCGPAADAAALYGLIARVRDLGLTLLSIESEQRETPPYP
ncbi:MAG: hypothetical protein ACJ78Q_11975 [Chloroflexia bacterium]